MRINWRIVEVSKQVLYFSTIFMRWSLASLSLMVLLSVCLRGEMVFSKKSVNEWVAEYENEKLWCIFWSRDGLSSLGFSYSEFWNAREEKGRFEGRGSRPPQSRKERVTRRQQSQNYPQRTGCFEKRILGSYQKRARRLRMEDRVRKGKIGKRRTKLKKG